MRQADLDEARDDWDAHVDNLDGLAAQKAEQLKAIVLLAATCAGFTMR